MMEVSFRATTIPEEILYPVTAAILLKAVILDLPLHPTTSITAPPRVMDHSQLVCFLKV